MLSHKSGVLGQLHQPVLGMLQLSKELEMSSKSVSRSPQRVSKYPEHL